jgi:hypothetical protein
MVYRLADRVPIVKLPAAFRRYSWKRLRSSILPGATRTLLGVQESRLSLGAVRCLVDLIVVRSGAFC